MSHVRVCACVCARTCIQTGAFQEACEKLDQHLQYDPEPEASVWLWKAVCKYGKGLGFRCGSGLLSGC